MLKLIVTAEADLVAKRNDGGEIARFAPAFEPAGAMRVARQNSLAFAKTPSQTNTVTSEAEVVVKEKA